MYTIVSGTNRIGSHTQKVALQYQKLLKDKNIDAKLFTLVNFNTLNRSPEFLKYEEEYLIPADKFIFIIPEYNGSYPLRGMDHLSDTLHYLKMSVFYNKLPISVINKVMDENGILNAETLKAIHQQFDEFIKF